MTLTAAEIEVIEQRAVVAYCDITGFMTWVKRSGASRSDVRSFIQNMKLEFRRFREETGYHTLPVGDGIIALLTFEKCAGRDLIRLLSDAWKLQKSMVALIKDTPYPRPTGFRIRVTAGLIYQTIEPPVDGKPVPRNIDFIGDCINLASRLLEVRRELPAIIHESVLELLTEDERKKLTLAPLKFTGRAPRGVDPEDMNGLFAYASK